MADIHKIGSDWIVNEIEGLTDTVEHVSPSRFIEENRYLPASVTSQPGPYSFDVNPFMREIVDCFDVDSPVREVNLKKGVQITYSTVLECGAMYFMCHIKTLPMMYITADKELATARIENNFLPMLQHSGFADIIRSSDVGNTRKSGKALCVNTVIPTPDGDRIMGDLSTGDYVFSIDGNPTKVITESPLHTRECYEITFANGEVITASDDHRWTVCRHGNKLKDITITTLDIFNKGVKKGKDYRYRVRIPSSVQCEYKELNIEPYTLGAWLGDGSSAGAKITAGDDSIYILEQIKKDGYFLNKIKNRNRCDNYTIKAHNEYKYNKGYGFKDKLDSYELINNKHIPPVYLYSSKSQRIRLLQGLMDTDGHATKRGECEIIQKNKRLSYDIWKLLNSLGIKASIRSRISKSQNGTKSKVYRIYFHALKSDNIFKIPRKNERLKDSLKSRTNKNSIIKIVPAGKRVVKCIGVEHESKLFLCGNGYIPTHNTANHLQFAGGGYLVPFGAKNADKMRSFSICAMLKDEIDAWNDTVGKDGDPDVLSDARCSGYWERRKIFRGSTPLIKHTSKIEKAYLKGDQRQYMILCKKCGFPQVLHWKGFKWETDDGRVVQNSVRYCCKDCGEPHFEHDKAKLFSEEHGAHWKPTTTPSEFGIRSYHLPAMYSPIGMAPWYKCVNDFLEGYDPETKKIVDIGKYQVFYNNILAEPFEIMGSKITFTAVSHHRRSAYMMGTVPNKHALKFAGSEILMLTCSVDVHKEFLAVKVMGVTKGFRTYTIDYFWIETENDKETFEDVDCPGWSKLRSHIEEKTYKSDDGKEYVITLTLIDAGWANDTVLSFCDAYESGVIPILGRDRTAKNQRIQEFAPFTTSSGSIGFRILVDHYKDRLAPVLRREWIEEEGIQPNYHFNAPLNTTDKSLKELTREKRMEKRDPKGVITHEWHRPGNARNEMWDLLVYCHAAVEIFAYRLCVEHFELENVDWDKFWTYLQENKLYQEQ